MKMISGSMLSRNETEFVKDQRVARIATVDLNDNYPHVVPICFVFDGISFYTTLPRHSKRLKNIENGSNVSLVIDDYDELAGKWVNLQGLLIKCKASVVSHDENKDLFMKGWHMLLKKYPQYKQWVDEGLSPKDPERRLIMQMQPIEKISWGFGSE